MDNEKLREELAQVFFRHNLHPSLRSLWKQAWDTATFERTTNLAREYADQVLASGIIQREVNEVVVGAYLAAAKFVEDHRKRAEDREKETGIPVLHVDCEKKMAESIRDMAPSDARAAFDEAVKRDILEERKAQQEMMDLLIKENKELLALIAELEAELKQWRASADITGALDLSAYRRACADRLAAILAKHKPKEKA